MENSDQQGLISTERAEKSAFVNVEKYDVAVIGGGPAGLAAALGARRAGVTDIIIIEREKTPGGILNQCIHDGFGLFLYRQSMSGPEYAERLAEDVVKAKIKISLETMVLDLTSSLVLRVSSRQGYRQIQARSVVLAMGCRERTREMILIPGTRPAGIYPAGLAQNLINLHNLKIGNEAVILGSGDIGLIMARRLMFEGIKVKGVFEILPWPGGLERNIRQCLLDFNIPLELMSTVVEIKGRERLEGVMISKVDYSQKVIAGTEKFIPCDTLLLSVGLIPENELSRRAGVILSPITGGAIVDETFMTSVSGIFSCGNVLHIHDVADWASFEGFAAGRSAAMHALGKGRPGETVDLEPGESIRYVVPQRVTKGKKGIEVNFRVKQPVRNIVLMVKGKKTGKTYFVNKFRKLLPSEMQKIKLEAKIEESLEVFCLE